MGYLVLVVALLISGIAAWYSIVGLAAIFAAAQIPIIVMGVSLEVGKIVTASWLYQNWHKVPFLLKSYLTGAVVILMFITSMGIFGFLSKAHIDQTVPAGNVIAQVEIIDQKIQTQTDLITSSRIVLKQMDEAVNQSLGRGAANVPANATPAQVQAAQVAAERNTNAAAQLRRNQQKERETQQSVINKAQVEIQKLRDERAPVAAELRKVEAEVGPIKYIAEFIYNDRADKDILEAAVRWVIVTIIFVFDPLAILLIIAANMTFNENKKKLTTKKIVTFTDIESPPVEEEREIDIDDSVEDFVNMSETELDLLIKEYELNPKSHRRGTFLNLKYRKLIAYRKSLDSSA